VLKLVRQLLAQRQTRVIHGFAPVAVGPGIIRPAARYEAVRPQTCCLISPSVGPSRYCW
jgi:hypothetical protein